MIGYNQIQRIASNEGVTEAVIEKDYFIELLLFYLSNNSLFKEKVVFRGGTCLKKIYFPDYRFSEDLDFIINKIITLQEIEKIFSMVLSEITAIFPFEPSITSNINNSRLQAFLKYDIAPEIKAYKNLKIYILQDNHIPNFDKKDIYFTYKDFKDKGGKLNTYILESIASDKISRILDVDNEVRDIYDLWYILNLKSINISKIKDEIKRRFGFIIPFSHLIESIKSDIYKKTWKTRLENQVHNLPNYETVTSDLERLIMRKFI